MQHKAKKSLGQNFLKSELALRKIIETGEIKENDVILEIGPGKGALTKKLLEKTSKVIAIEKDKELFDFLKVKFEKEIKSSSLVLVHDDILKFDLSQTISKFLSGPRFSGSLSQPDHAKNLKSFGFKVIANIPYNITGAILKKFLTGDYQPERMVLMVQNEVAQRIVARDGKESLLSISVKAYGEPKIIMKVPARYFSPAPKVDSAVISITNISRKNFLPPLLDKEGNEGRSDPLALQVLPLIKGEKGLEEKFWEIVKTGFAHKRKKLSGNLKIPGLALSSLDSSLGNKRAEDLTLENWISITKIISKA